MTLGDHFPTGFALMGDPDIDAPSFREFVIEGHDGSEMHASNGRIGLTVLADGATRIRKRNAIKQALSPAAHKVQWLYGELDGIRCYVKDDGGSIMVVLTRQDLYP